MNAVVIYESLTGNTAKAGRAIAAGLTAGGVPTEAFPITAIDYQALADAELVIVGSWTDGLILFGQRPGRVDGAGRDELACELDDVGAHRVPTGSGAASSRRRGAGVWPSPAASAPRPVSERT